MSSHTIHTLLHEYGLGLVVVATAVQAFGVPLPGGTALAAAAVYASTKHGFDVVAVLACGAAGAFIGASGAYALGRWRGEIVLVRIARLARRTPEQLDALRGRIIDHAWPAVILGRFFTGVRNVVGLLAGATGVPSRIFLPATVVSATAWSALITLEYYFFGHAIGGAATWLQITLVVVGIGATILSLGMMRRGADLLDQPRPSDP